MNTNLYSLVPTQERYPKVASSRLILIEGKKIGNELLWVLLMFLAALIFGYFTPFGHLLNKNAAPSSHYGSFVQFADSLLTELNSMPSSAYKEKFILKRQLLISQLLIEERVSRVEQLDEMKRSMLMAQIADLYVAEILPRIAMEQHVRQYITENDNLVLRLALEEQASHHIPSSIKIAQSAIETGYGKKVSANNFFGIKDKSNASSPIVTTEVFTEEQFQDNKHKVLTYEKLFRQGTVLYACKLKDSFQHYASAEESFKAHSTFLSENERYAELFAYGKDYEQWADSLGPSHLGGTGYATLPNYGSIIKKVIRKYHLDLLDF